VAVRNILSITPSGNLHAVTCAITTLLVSKSEDASDQ